MSLWVGNDMYTHTHPLSGRVWNGTLKVTDPVSPNKNNNNKCTQISVSLSQRDKTNTENRHCFFEFPFRSSSLLKRLFIGGKISRVFISSILTHISWNSRCLNLSTYVHQNWIFFFFFFFFCFLLLIRFFLFFIIMMKCD